MIEILKRFLKAKPKAILLDNTYRIIPAFECKGETYYMHEDPLNTSTGRGLTAMMIYEEVLMRCSSSYLQQHIEAYESIFSNPKSINIPALIKLNANLKERVNMLTALPEHVYKMASVVFFTKDESPFKYDPVYNKKKIKDWMEADGMYDFFLQTPLKTLMPFLELPKTNSQNYLAVQEKINNIHLKDLHGILSKTT